MLSWHAVGCYEPPLYDADVSSFLQLRSSLGSISVTATSGVTKSLNSATKPQAARAEVATALDPHLKVQ